MDRLSYPNPQFIRKKWIDLNGEWLFCFNDDNYAKRDKKYLRNDFFDQTIQVPYSYQTKKSGIESAAKHSVVWYKKTIQLTIEKCKRYIIHFGAVDYECDIWLNDYFIFHHEGGFTPFSIDLTDYLTGKDELVLRVVDETSCRQALGKQSWKDYNFLCWYTQTTGIWQQVWLEITGETYLTDIQLTPFIDSASLMVEAKVNNKKSNTLLKTTIHYKGEVIRSVDITLKDGTARFSVDVSSTGPNFRLNFWSPSSPNLYDISFTVIEEEQEMDRVDSYFGMRQVKSKNNKIYLNNQEYYQKLILDQGYFKDGGMTGTPTELVNDIEKIKEMGFNGVRKHQKIEDHRFMYLCDYYGLVMWAEMPSPFEYSAETNQNIFRELHPFIQKHYNHPSVIAYTLMNESWGINEVYQDKLQQNFVNALFYATKSLDNTRLVIGNDGWEQTLTDVLTFHDYVEEGQEFRESYKNMEVAANGSPSRTSGRHAYAKGYCYDGEPVIISEYGGVAFKKEEDLSTWGYGERLDTEAAVIKRIQGLTEAIMDNESICGFCYTQLSDVEQEVNGLLDENHNYKFDPKEIKKIMSYKHNLGFKFL